MNKTALIANTTKIANGWIVIRDSVAEGRTLTRNTEWVWKNKQEYRTIMRKLKIINGENNHPYGCWIIMFWWLKTV